MKEVITLIVMIKTLTQMRDNQTLIGCPIEPDKCICNEFDTILDLMRELLDKFSDAETHNVIADLEAQLPELEARKDRREFDGAVDLIARLKSTLN